MPVLVSVAAAGSLNTQDARAHRFATTSVAQSGPSAPTELAQFKLDGDTPIAVGGRTTETGAVLKGMVVGGARGRYRLAIEIKPLDSYIRPMVRDYFVEHLKPRP